MHKYLPIEPPKPAWKIEFMKLREVLDTNSRDAQISPDRTPQTHLENGVHEAQVARVQEPARQQALAPQAAALAAARAQRLQRLRQREGGTGDLQDWVCCACLLLGAREAARRRRAVFAKLGARGPLKFAHPAQHHSTAQQHSAVGEPCIW